MINPPKSTPQQTSDRLDDATEEILAEQGTELTGRQLQAFALLGEAINACRQLAGEPPLVDTRPFTDKLASRGLQINQSGAIEPIPQEESEQP